MRRMSLAVVVRWSLVAVGLAASVSIAGCGAGPGESTGETSEAVNFANDKAAFDYFLGKGLASFQAAGIVGNLDQESGVDPLAVQSGGPGRGIAQWSVGGRWDTDPNDNATAYAAQQGQSVDSLQLQLDFIWYELTTISGYGLAALKASTDVTSATIAFQNDFEGCGTCDQATRIAYAQNVLSLYGSDSGDSGGDAGSGAPSCTVPGVGTGVCILTTDCAAMPGHVSTPGYCPGPANEECCTGPSNDSGTPTDAGGKPPGDSGSGSSGSDSGSSSGGSSGGSSSGSGMQDAATAPGDGGRATASGSKKGCSTSPGGASGSSAGYWMTALAWIAIRRRKRA
jgi:MYXO-CTERM domain-containing protein